MKYSTSGEYIAWTTYSKDYTPDTFTLDRSSQLDYQNIWFSDLLIICLLRECRLVIVPHLSEHSIIHNPKRLNLIPMLFKMSNIIPALRAHPRNRRGTWTYSNTFKSPRRTIFRAPFTTVKFGIHTHECLTLSGRFTQDSPHIGKIRIICCIMKNVPFPVRHYPEINSLYLLS
jgi:hypothetical protein